MSKFDYNLIHAERDQDPVPAGIYQLAITVKPFNSSTVLRPAKSGFTKMLELELTVVGGEHDGRKIGEFLTLEFDEQSYEENGPCDQTQNQAARYRQAETIGRKRLRSMMESVNGINPKDESDDAEQKRLIHGNDFLALNGLNFWAKVGVEANDGYRPKNYVNYCLTPASWEWASRPISKRQGAKPARVAVVPLRDDVSDEIPF